MSSQTEKFWTGKKVLITGASSGLGAALVQALVPYKVHFCLLSRRAERMEELIRNHANGPSQFWIRSCDVRIREQVESAVGDFASAVGVPDVAWVNSGVVGDTSFAHWDWNVVENILDTNLKGALYTAYACLKFMVLQNHGAIVAISSAAAMRGLGGRSIYSLTKIGLAYFMESMAVELPQIQFTTIFPGFVDTPANRNNPNRFWLLTPENAAQKMIRAVAKGKPIYIYPLPMKLLFHAIRALPAPLYRALSRRTMRITRPGR
ncbi:SDR family NAD(P)-dependent oxidoreductase [bacterium]|nr:SDR family NAD(P)-dependent oxidoreductase [bacterium]